MGNLKHRFAHVCNRFFNFSTGYRSVKDCLIALCEGMAGLFAYFADAVGFCWKRKLGTDWRSRFYALISLTKELIYGRWFDGVGGRCVATATLSYPPATPKKRAATPPQPDAAPLQLAQANGARERFVTFNRQLAERGLLVKQGPMVDTPFVKEPCQRNSPEDNKKIKQGETPYE